MFNLTNKQAKVLDELIMMERPQKPRMRGFPSGYLQTSARRNMIISSRKEVMTMAYRRKARRGEMEEITRWYDDETLKWVRTYGEEGIEKYEEVYTWKTKNGEVRHSKNPKYAFKKIMEVKYGNLGYND